MMEYLNVCRQQGCDRGLRIDELDDELSHNLNGKLSYLNVILVKP